MVARAGSSAQASPTRTLLLTRLLVGKVEVSGFPTQTAATAAQQVIASGPVAMSDAFAQTATSVASQLDAVQGNAIQVLTAITANDRAGSATLTGMAVVLSLRVLAANQPSAISPTGIVNVLNVVFGEESSLQLHNQLAAALGVQPSAFSFRLTKPAAIVSPVVGYPPPSTAPASRPAGMC